MLVMKMKKYIIYAFLIFVLSTILGYYVYGLFYPNQEESKEEIADIIKQNDTENESVLTDSSEEKVSIHTMLTFNVYYTKCDHTQTTYDRDNAKYVNLTREELEKEFDGWEITEFSEDDVVFEKEVDNICPKHFIIRAQEGMVTVYHIVNNEEVLYKVTDIAVEYLTEEDMTRINNGIYVYGDNELNATLEDFE